MDIIGSIFNVVKTLFCLAQGVSCHRKTVVIIPKRCGKSTIASKFTSVNPKQILCDIESLISMSLSAEQKETLQTLTRSQEWSSIRLFLLPLYRDFVKDLTMKFKHNNIILFTSSPDVSTYLNITSKLVYVPSTPFFEEILAREAPSDQVLRKTMTQSRNEIVATYGDKCRVFSSYADLERMITEDCALSAKI
jgi:hypothetical protein